jgi:uncharacterized RDD family membrane protein YckC
MTYLKRVFAKIIDITIPFTVSGLGYLIVDKQANYANDISKIIPITIFMSIFYLLYIVLGLLFTKGQTIGELILKIESVTIKGNSSSFVRIFIKELVYSFFIFYMFIYNSGWIPFLLLSAPVVKLKDDSYLLIVLDFVFGLKYIKSQNSTM